jgi:hypothetical protein
MLSIKPAKVGLLILVAALATLTGVACSADKIALTCSGTITDHDYQHERP